MSKKYWIIITATALAVAVVFLLRGYADPFHSGQRIAWKNKAISELQIQIDDKPRVQQAIAAVKKPSYEWVGDELLLMKNGEWIACRNICRKQDARIHDLFIGLASDGKWYYSTFHFCVGKEVLHMGSQPENLGDFVDAYWLKPFDGKSDECLGETWTGETWGDEKLQSRK